MNSVILAFFFYYYYYMIKPSLFEPSIQQSGPSLFPQLTSQISHKCPFHPTETTLLKVPCTNLNLHSSKPFSAFPQVPFPISQPPLHFAHE